MSNDFIGRDVNGGFSGGEKKRNEILQMALLGPELSILDETDSGLDIDALKTVAAGVNAAKSSENGIILITHYQVSTSPPPPHLPTTTSPPHHHRTSAPPRLRVSALHAPPHLRPLRPSNLARAHPPPNPTQRLLDYIKPDFVHVMSDGKIAREPVTTCCHL